METAMSTENKPPASPRPSRSYGAFATAEKSLKTIEDQTVVEPLDIPQDATERSVTGLSWLVMILAILSSTFLYALDNVILANVRPSITDTFGRRMDMLPWLSVSYAMGEVGANPLWGKLNDQFNNKFLYLAAVLIFEVGSAVIGSAQSIEAVVAGRAIAGFGGSGIYVGTINIISAITLPAERTQYLNFVGMSWSLGTILGPVIGGAFADSAATWRWAFYINICIAALAAPACILLVPPVVPSTSLSVVSRIKRIDYLGAVLFLGGVITTTMIMAFGGAVYSWNSGAMLGLYVAMPVIWAIFCVQQRFHLFTTNRIFPAQLVGDWEMAIMFAWTALAIANVVVTIYSLPLFFQFRFADSSLGAAAYTLPFIGSAVASAGAGGPLLAKYPVYWVWFAGASALMLVSNGLLSTINYDTGRGAVCGFTVIQGFACGPVLQLGYTVAQTKVPRRAVPDVSAFLTCAQMSGLALSLGIATSVFLNGATDDIAALLPGVPRDVIQWTIDGAKTTIFQDLSPETQARVLEAVARNVGKVFYLNVAGGALGFVMSLLMKRQRLNLDPQ